MIRVHGYLGQVTERLHQDAASADLVVGGRRHLDALGVPEDRRVVLGPLSPAVEALRELPPGGRAVVVASGDPLLFGVVRSLRKAGLEVEVVPAISSFQAAFAAVGLPWDDAQLVSAHAGGIDAAVRVCRTHPKVGVLTSPRAGVRDLASALGGSGKHFVVAERLGEPGQRVRVLTADEVLALGEDDIAEPNVVLVLDHDPASPEAIGTTPQLQGDPNAGSATSATVDSAGTETAGDGGEPVIGQVYNSNRSRTRADEIESALGVTTRRYDMPASRGLVAAWQECDLIVSHLALGATTRLIAPLLADKHTDPGVVVVDEAGRFAIPLVGGHVGGANDLARRIGEGLGATAVVSTATDSLGIPALDQLGWGFEGDVAHVTGAIIDGRGVRLVKRHPWTLPPLPPNVSPDAATPVARIVVTDEATVGDDPVSGDLPTVVLHPRSLVVGMGCNKGTETDELQALLDETLAEAGLSPASLAAIVSVDLKASELGLVKLAHRLGVPFLTYPASELDAQPVPNPSEIVRAEVGTGSVSEASVLAHGAQLVVGKRKSPVATCAVGRIPARGRLHVVGLGPGARDLLTPRAARVVRNANHVVGYAPYVRQVRDLVSPYAEVLATKMGTEETRVAAAIESARSGNDVAFVCGGDPSIYAMASPTLEMGTDGIDVDIVPGVTAELAVSAILGAPLGHDHATISLSDLHTDWDVICERVRAAAQGDLVITLYNPRSRTRRHHLPDALAIIASHRGPGTPVAVVAQAERRQQAVHLSTLADFQPEWVDMNSLVVVGSSTTRFVTSGSGDLRMVTPRDYHWMAATQNPPEEQIPERTSRLDDHTARADEPSGAKE
ncbi:hypothetical protein GCM10009785_07370 [Brooklawnia cerclae]|uniref:Precorrin-3B C17-methyltransferase/precorrin-6y C5,15-methyltransferase (Decarboxylating) CbiE subunit n=1 Tax=Brooklawnia cerclae TaxID=349934 RepID=A0ABX0SK08_9ACTN|nr:precorrin-3B C17-methyltransferase/precorrin-6y C5,15-methyltransferase (decarboxylating) CbiE subunit [Brooklawnia cerclae]